MSRIIVKNLPAKIKEKELRQVFGVKGFITDVQCKFTEDGVFRRFAFIGYKSEEEAEAAKEYFDNTFVRSSKVSVDVCRSLGDPEKPRAWSRHAKEKTKNSSPEKKESEKKMKTDEKKKKHSKELETFEELKEDPRFLEFLEVNKKRGDKSMCSNDTGGLQKLTMEPQEDQDDSSGDEDADDDVVDKDIEEEPTSSPPKEDKKSHPLSDLEYLKSKVVSEKTSAANVKKAETKSKLDAADQGDKFTVTVRNLPYKCKKKDVKSFFHPIKLLSVRLPRKIKGMAYAQFKLEKELRRALNKNKSFFNGRKIDVSRFEAKSTTTETKPIREDKWAAAAEALTKEETVAESGRLFIRNLSYSCTEDDLEKLFSKYGPLTEVNLPVDTFTSAIKGFGFITFVFPEHAARAFSEKDGKIFQGRVLHILPSKPKPTEEETGGTFKEQKIAKEKELGSTNWNTLFLGANAVAEAMSAHYGTKKSEILNPESSESLAVRLALGETQLVVETRKFLQENGVHLPVFQQANTARSKTILLVKNLPADTVPQQLQELFSRHGRVKRVVLPPHGITAIVEFIEPKEARTAFSKLAYTKFEHVPLYLEWAPIEIFVEKADQQESEKVEVKDKPKEDEDGEETMEVVEPEPNSTLYVGNLNFETTDEALEKHFKRCGPIQYARVSTKKDVKNAGVILSTGYGFVQFQNSESAATALKDLQGSQLDDHLLVLKMSHRTLPQTSYANGRKASRMTVQKSSKIMVRNIPFQATKAELEKLFSTFGILKAVRIPRSLNKHRGFAFVEFCTRHEAKRAFDALSASTHLYGRRLVLEWAEQEEDADHKRPSKEPTSSSKKRKLTAAMMGERDGEL